MKLPDGPKLSALLQILQIIAQPTKFLETCAQRYGDTFTLKVLGRGSPPVVFFSAPEAIEAIFTDVSNRLDFGQVTEVFRPLVGSQSLIFQQGKQHQLSRQLLMPPLHGKSLASYGEQIQAITSTSLQSWSEGTRLKIRDYTAQITLQVILQVVFGVGSFGLDSCRRAEQLQALIPSFLERVNSPWQSVQFFWPPLQQDWGAWSPWGQFLRQRQQIDNLIYAEIAERRIEQQKQEPGNDVLSMLVSARTEMGKPLGDEELRDQLITVLLLGQDTTASALAWAFYWIHQHPEVRSRLVQELSSLGEHPDPVTVAQLPYLNAICQETLRIHPIALIAQPRQVREQVELEGYSFAPGTILVPCIHLAHHRSNTFSHPEVFNPERFLNRKFSPYEYFPFGGGSRSCIGMALSLFEMKLILATVLSRYGLELANSGPVRPTRRGITIVPSDAFQLRVTHRRQTNAPKELSTL
ncbi:MAG: cytochrome P450 [Microcoleaceae cyanobacterium]